MAMIKLSSIPVFIAFLLPTVFLGQDYGNKDFYLVDSLDISAIEVDNKRTLDSSLNLYHEATDKLTKISYLNYYVRNTSDLISATKINQYALEALEGQETSYDPDSDEEKAYYKLLGRTYSTQAIIKKNSGLYAEAIANCLSAVKYQKIIKNDSDIVVSYNNLGGVYSRLNQTDSAQYYFQIALEVSEKIGKSFDMYRLILGNIAVEAEKQGDNEKASELHRELITLCEEVGDLNCMARSSKNLGTMFLASGDLDKATQHLLKAKDLFLKLDDKMWLSYSHLSLGKVYEKRGLIKKAISSGLKANEYAEKANLSHPLMYSSRLLYRLYKQVGKYDSALKYYETFVSIQDSLSGIELKMSNARKELEFEFGQSQLKLENETNLKLEIAKKNEVKKEYIALSILALLGISLIFGIIYFYRFRITVAQKKIIEKQSSERKTLLKEIHHRVKNNFQIVISILRLQSSQENNELVQQSFQDAIARIHSMSSVHELIYRNENFTEINPEAYFLNLTNSMRNYTSKDRIKFEVKSEIESLNVETLIPIGIAVNELITNSIKYAFNDTIEAPQIKIYLTHENGEKTLTYRDNGIGIDESKFAGSFGIELIQTILEKIDGVLKTEESSVGVHVKFSFK